MRTFEQLESLWNASPQPPQHEGTVRLVVLRKGNDIHETPETANLSPQRGLEGDRWQLGGSPDTEEQVTLMNVRAAELVADGQPLDLPGDNLLVDLDLSEDTLPVGARVRAGSALLEISAKPHTGCQKFSARFGQDALRWVNWKEHRGRRLRGVNCRVIEGGRVAVGDVCRIE